MSQVRIVASLALLYAFRMLGLFMVLPILMLYGDAYSGATPMLLGLALGVYGLTQACFQIPLGMLSDVVGRKPIIILGLVVFALGSVVAATTDSVFGLIIGRALQGAGAIASAIMAMLADLTSEENRTKAMAAIGASIGLSFSVAMILGPAVAANAGLPGVFFLSALLSLIGIAIVVFIIPKPKAITSSKEVVASPALFRSVAANMQLGRLNIGIFSLHAILMISFVGVPGLVENTLSLAKDQHWKFYLPILFTAFAVMLPFIVIAEKKRKIKPVFLAAVSVLALSNLLLVYLGNDYLWVVFSMFIFFVAFNLLESILPSLVSKISPAGAKGTAMGLYSTSQFLGAFCGGVIGGLLTQLYSAHMAFGFSAMLAFVWLCVACSMAAPRHLSSVCVPAGDRNDAVRIARINGVIEVFHSDEDSLLYIKIDRDILDDVALRDAIDAAPS